MLRGDRAHLTNSDRVAGGDPPLIPDLLALVGDAADGYPGIPGIGAKDCCPAFDSLRADRKLSAAHSRPTAQARVALQETRDAALAQSDAGIREVGQADGSAAATRAVRKGCGPMTMH